MKAKSRRICMSALALSFSLSALARAGETAEPTADGYRIRQQTLQLGLVWLVFPGDKAQAAYSPVEVIGDKAIKFHDAAGKPYIVRSDVLDMAATLRANELIREARWVDPETEQWGKAKVRKLTPDEQRVYMLELKAEIDHDINVIRDATVKQECGSRGGLCEIAAVAKADRKVNEIISQARADAAKLH